MMGDGQDVNNLKKKYDTTHDQTKIKIKYFVNKWKKNLDAG